MKLHWHRFGASGAGLGWYATTSDDHRHIVAEAFKTGSHLDDYPWDWHFPDGTESGVADTLKSAKHQAQAAFDVLAAPPVKEKVGGMGQP